MDEISQQQILDLYHNSDRHEYELQALTQRLDELEHLALAQQIDMNKRIIRATGRAIRQVGQGIGFVLAILGLGFFWYSASSEARSTAANKIISECVVPIITSLTGLGIAVSTRQKIDAVEAENERGIK